MKKAVAAMLAVLIFIFCFSFSALAETTVTVSSAKVNVRSGAATTFDKLGVVTKDEVFTAIREQNGWYQIKYVSATAESAWISGDYVTIGQNEELPGFVSALETNVNVRAGAGTDQAWLGQLVFGTKYAVTGESGFWYEIVFAENKKGYVAKWLCLTYEKEPEPEPEQVPEDDPDAGAEQEPIQAHPELFAAAAALKHGTVNTNELNLRSGPATSYDKIAALAGGTQVAIYERQGDWLRVISESGIEGFVHSGYIDMQNAVFSLERGGSAELPRWNENGSTVGIMELSVSAEDMGICISLSSDMDIVYEMLPVSDGYDFVSDMSFHGTSGTLNNVTWKLEGKHYNRMHISSPNGIYYRAEESADRHELQIFISTYPVLDKIIYLDAGHSVWNKGVLDPGAIGQNGTKENAVVLAITQKLRDVLESYGAVVYLTHEGSSTLSRPERCELANSAGADIFVSIHANSSTNNTVKGTTVYTYAPLGNSKFDRNKRIRLAGDVLNSILASLDLKSFGVRETGYDVLVYTKMPAILVETAFISNLEEEALLADPIWQQQMAEAIADGICDYFR